MKKVNTYFRNLFVKFEDKVKKNEVLSLTIFGVAVATFIYLMSSSFAVLQPVKSVEIYSKNLSYQNKEPGAWKVTQSSKWISKGEAEVTIDINSIKKVSEKYTDLLFVLDTSGSININTLSNLKLSINNLVDEVLKNTNNKIGLITFNSTSEILSNLTNNKEILKNSINTITADGETNYYAALKNVENILEVYKPENNREFIVVFFTDGYPNIDTPNEIGEYNYLKKQYPFITINAIQNRIGPVVIDPLKQIGDNLYNDYYKSLSDILEEAAIPSILYNSFKLENIINMNYFTIENVSKIEVNQGNVKYDKITQKIEWLLNDYKTGSEAKLTVRIKLNKDENTNIYSILNSTMVNSEIGNVSDNIESTVTPIISSKYKVKYDGNFPNGCSVVGVPTDTNYYVFDTVGISDKKLVCNGYQFKGWKVVTDEIRSINADYFIMPESDVEIRGLWSKLKINKSMNGTIKEKFTLYDQIEQDVLDPTKYAKKYTGNTSTFNDTKNIYYYYGEATNNNVIFANYCWKIVRTTDTGGVKLLYNGVPDAGNKCNNTGDASHLTAAQMNLSSNKVEFNKQYQSPADVGYMYNNETRYQYFSSIVTSRAFLMGNSFTYANGTYTLTNTLSSFVNSSTVSNLTNYHYTCFDSTGSCTTLYYIFYFSNPYGYYLELTGGKSVENVIDEMLFNDNVNKDSSTIKQAIDYWYEHNMISFTKYLEDTVWCNDRSIYNLGGWNPNGGSMTTDLYFNSNVNLSNLTCQNVNDRFTKYVENGNGKLSYPVGLITRQEQNLAYSSSSPLGSGNDFWGLSPSYFDEGYRAFIYDVVSGGWNSNSYVYYPSGVRPSISLRTGIEYSSGDGSTNFPYVILTD